jgi:hypothetical protein
MSRNKAQPEADRPNTVANRPDSKVVEGKFVIAKTSLRGCFYPDDGVLPGEDAEVFAQFSETVYGEFVPVGTVETSLVERIVWTLWRMRRVPRTEAGRYIWHRYAQSRDGIPGYDEKEFRARVEDATAERYAPAPPPASAQDRVAIEADRIVEDGLFGHSWHTDTSDLSRYEAQLDRRLKKLMDELNRYRRPR